MTVLFAFAGALAIGGLLASAACGAQTREPRSAGYLFRASLAAGLGIAVTSIVFLGLRVAGLGAPVTIVLAEPFCIALAARLWWKGRAPAQPPPRKAKPRAPWIGALGFGFVAIFCADFYRVCQLSQANPAGEWDAWSDWNLRAKFLAGSVDWRAASAPLLMQHTHPEYPLLLPAFIARCWRLAGDTAFIEPMITGLLFFTALAGLLVGGVVLLRGWTAGFMAGLLLLASRPLLGLGWAQYADIPLAYFMLATLLLLFLDYKGGQPEPGYSPLVVCAGFCAGMCAWTKLEGGVFLAIVALAFPALEWLRVRHWLPAIKRAAAFGAGAAPGFLLTVWYRLFISPPSHFSQQSTREVLDKLHDASRYSLIGQGVFSHLKFVGDRPSEALGWGAGHPLILMAILALLLVRDGDTRYRTPVSVSVIAVAGMLASYFLAYLVTPDPLQWQINTTVHRLTAQIWPSCVLLFCRLLPKDGRRRS